MSDFLNRMKSAAKADLKTIVLPEARIRALSSRPPKSSRRAWQRSSSWQPRRDQRSRRYRHRPAQCREARGVRAEVCRAPRQEGRYHRAGSRPGDGRHLLWHHDGQDGRCRRPGLRRLPLHRRHPAPRAQILKTAPGTKLVSAFFVMCTDTPQFGTDGTLIFADCGLNINPSSDELSEIAIASAHSWSTFMGNVERTWPCSPTPPWAPLAARSPRRSRRL